MQIRPRYAIGLLLFVCGYLTGNLLRAQCACTPEQRTLDSTQLVNFYQLMNGENWRLNMNWTAPGITIGEWAGVTFTEGCLTCLDLDGKLDTLSGPLGCSGCFVRNNTILVSESNNVRPRGGGWPEGFSLPCLKAFTLEQNPLNILLPDFSGFDELCELYLRATGVRGTLDPALFGNLNLDILNLNANDLTGGITEEWLVSVPNLRVLLIDRNDLRGILPELSGTNLDQLNIKMNRFTFADLLPNFAVNTAKLTEFSYAPQQKIYPTTDTTVALGLPFTLPLGVDEGVESNNYRWEHNGVLRPEQNSNTLTFDQFTEADTGLYLVEITNPGVPELVLKSDTIWLHSCVPGVDTVVAQICLGGTFSRDGSPAFTGDTLYRLPVTAKNGCDSVWDLRISELPEPIIQIDTFTCVGRRLEFAGVFRDTGIHEILLEDRDVCGRQRMVILDVAEATVDALGAAEIKNPINCGTPFQPGSNQPAGTFGRWLLPPGVTASELTDTTAVITGVVDEETRIGWELGAGACPAYDTAEVVVQLATPVVARNDRCSLRNDQSLSLEQEIDVLRNDSGFVDVLDVTLELTSPPILGSVRFEEDLTGFIYTRVPGVGLDSFAYSIQGDFCPPDTATVYLEIEQVVLGEDDPPPNVITPNGDGLNDVLIIPLIEHQQGNFPNSQLSIYDRNGQLIHQIKNYQNKWAGTDASDNPLPAGKHYYYIIDYGDGRPADWSRLIILYRAN